MRALGVKRKRERKREKERNLFDLSEVL